MSALLEVNNLEVFFSVYGGSVQAVRGAAFHVNKGETLALVGESGSGKSVTAQSIIGAMSHKRGTKLNGSILFKGKDVLKMKKRQLYEIRGSEIGFVFQDPMTSLNPTMTIGKQIEEGVTLHQQLSKKEVKKTAIELIRLVGIPDAEQRYHQYPHEFSGGMRQRVIIAIALACKPELIIADEPTTALDVTIQAQILDLLRDIQTKNSTAILLITHDLGVVAESAQRVAVMYAGMIVETGTVEEIFDSPKHPYTWGLLNSVPRLERNERLTPIEGSPPDLFEPPRGCPFVERCKYAMEVCVQHLPPSTAISGDHRVLCWLLDERANRDIGERGEQIV
ncbi:ABC transporter ATP-binding protein [Cytobacillus purgationiresistens]|uniref:Oligopeptide transport system ATP-binding protein n=1 Tax=Cytobacillus purgationiresistens TaxID=863449 RepID=A0ABU0AR35_9BACI|nr:ABC transporter ATP-binding protein [Cytobacillus purgationiresistens]MDQ0273668.1 oligopeptide transport system ATP-binding protein [Cytobacillus purgationiresistens]